MGCPRTIVGQSDSSGDDVQGRCLRRQDRPFERQAAARARPGALDEEADSPRLALASPEDVVLAKLEWYRLGGEVSERQWWDIIGVLKVAAPVDEAYLRQWAASLAVTDLLDRALSEARS